MRRPVLRWRRLRGLIERVRRIGRLIGLLGWRGGSLLIRISTSRRGLLEEPKVSFLIRGHVEFVPFSEAEEDVEQKVYAVE